MTPTRSRGKLGVDFTPPWWIVPKHVKLRHAVHHQMDGLPLSFCLLPRRGEEALPPLSQCRSLFKVTHPNPKFRARVLDPEDILAELWLGVGSSLVVGHFKI